MSGIYIEIKFNNKIPNNEQINIINQALKSIDYDFPEITGFGIDEGYWRKPLLSMEGILCLLHQAGFPCEGREIDSDEYFYLHGFLNDKINSKLDYSYFRKEELQIWKEMVLDNNAFI